MNLEINNKNKIGISINTEIKQQTVEQPRIQSRNRKENQEIS